MKNTRLALLPGAEGGDGARIDLTPMLDVVFIMLIFFLVAASFLKMHGLDIGQTSDAVTPSAAAKNILVTITAVGDISVDGRPVHSRALPASITQATMERPGASLAIDAHGASPTRALVIVLDAARRAGVTDYALAAPEPL